MLFRSVRLPTLLLLLSSALISCRTSKDVSSGHDESNDPVKTVDNPELNSTPSGDGLQRELAIAQGELEDLRNAAQRERESLNARIATLEQENQRLSTELAQAKAPPAAPAPEVEEESVVDAKKLSAEKLWESIRRELRSGEMKDAAAHLEIFAKRFANGPRGLSATLLLGMVQYRLQNYKDAAFTFNQAIDKYPKKSDLSMAWLGQGAAFLHMGQREDSLLFFEEVMRLYPKSAEAREAKVLIKKKSKAPADLFAVFSVWTSKILR